MVTSDVVIRMEGVSFGYPGDQSRRPVLDDLHLQINRGDRVGLIGSNGSGKTTLFHLIMGLLFPTQGEIEVFGEKRVQEKDFREVRAKIGLCFRILTISSFAPPSLKTWPLVR